LVVILLVGNWPLDRFGRKPMLWAVQIFMIIAAIIECFATNWTHWLAAKIMNVCGGSYLRRTNHSSFVRVSLWDATRWQRLPTFPRLHLHVLEVQHSASTSSSCVDDGRYCAGDLRQMLTTKQWALGSFGAAIALQIAVYSQWVFVGLAIIVLLLIPETPRFYALKGDHEMAKQILLKVNSSVPNYDLEHEYAIILKEIEDGRILAAKQSGVTVLDCFRGTNLVSPP
jgi:SP family general alpha glucoside:H+ symporter-like MFS transporter